MIDYDSIIYYSGTSKACGGDACYVNAGRFHAGINDNNEVLKVVAVLQIWKAAHLYSAQAKIRLLIFASMAFPSASPQTSRREAAVRSVYYAPTSNCEGMGPPLPSNVA